MPLGASASDWPPFAAMFNRAVWMIRPNLNRSLPHCPFPQDGTSYQAAARTMTLPLYR